MRRHIVLLTAAIGLPSCSSSLTVQELANNAPAGAEVDGIPFRIPRAYTATLYKANDVANDTTPKAYSDQGNAASRTSVTAPDMDHLYVLGFKGQPLSNPTVNVTLNTDNTISSVSLSSSPSGQAALTAVATQVTAVNGAFKANRTGGNAATSGYAAALSAYYIAMQPYCVASKATPPDRNAIRTAAANVLISEVTLTQARETAGAVEALPFSRQIDPSSDVGVGCS